jgi:hypothetical protein
MYLDCSSPPVWAVQARPGRALRARAPVPAWARRAVGEGVKSCPRAGCGRSTSPGSMSFHGKESVGIQGYALSNPDFPHQSTINQWFSESQLEAYRSLAFEIMGGIIARASQDPEYAEKPNVETLFTSLYHSATGNRNACRPACRQ